jgi:hypothetical protein
MKLYVASSWRNEEQPSVVCALRQAGHEVYDFRHPEPDNDGFSWNRIDPAWKTWSTLSYAKALQHPIALHGFGLDFAALQWAEGCVLVLPCGKSAHLELGFMLGAGKPGIILAPEKIEPELMYLLAGPAPFAGNIEGVLAWAGGDR